VGAPQVNYRESISKSASVKYTHKKQSGGSGQYAEVSLKFEPLEPGSGFEFATDLKAGLQDSRPPGPPPPPSTSLPLESPPAPPPRIPLHLLLLLPLLLLLLLLLLSISSSSSSSSPSAVENNACHVKLVS